MRERGCFAIDLSVESDQIAYPFLRQWKSRSIWSYLGIWGWHMTLTLIQIKQTPTIHLDRVSYIMVAISRTKLAGQIFWNKWIGFPELLWMELLVSGFRMWIVYPSYSLHVLWSFNMCLVDRFRYLSFLLCDRWWRSLGSTSFVGCGNKVDTFRPGINLDFSVVLRGVLNEKRFHPVSLCAHRQRLIYMLNETQ